MRVKRPEVFECYPKEHTSLGGHCYARIVEVGNTRIPDKVEIMPDFAYKTHIGFRNKTFVNVMSFEAFNQLYKY